jgi:hypothetical protein
MPTEPQLILDPISVPLATTSIQPPTPMSQENLRLLAKNLATDFPRSPRTTLGGYVLAARCIDKCRAVLNDSAGEYHYNCPLDQMFLKFAGIDSEELKKFVATGASDDGIASWIKEHAKQTSKLEVIKWNNKLRDTRLSDLPDDIQEFMEGYIAKYVPRHKVVYHWFDVYDYEEHRL